MNFWALRPWGLSFYSSRTNISQSFEKFDLETFSISIMRGPSKVTPSSALVVVKKTSWANAWKKNLELSSRVVCRRRIMQKWWKSLLDIHLTTKYIKATHIRISLYIYYKKISLALPPPCKRIEVYGGGGGGRQQALIILSPLGGATWPWLVQVPLEGRHLAPIILSHPRGCHHHQAISRLYHLKVVWNMNLK